MRGWEGGTLTWLGSRNAKGKEGAAKLKEAQGSQPRQGKTNVLSKYVSNRILFDLMEK